MFSKHFRDLTPNCVKDTRTINTLFFYNLSNYRKRILEKGMHQTHRTPQAIRNLFVCVFIMVFNPQEMAVSGF